MGWTDFFYDLDEKTKSARREIASVWLGRLWSLVPLVLSLIFKAVGLRSPLNSSEYYKIIMFMMVSIIFISAMELIYIAGKKALNNTKTNQKSRQQARLPKGWWPITLLIVVWGVFIGLFHG